MNYIRNPKVRLVSRPSANMHCINEFIHDNGFPYPQGDIQCRDSEHLCETAGRVCYMSFGGKGRKTNKEYIQHILEVGHGSVLEHANWGFIIEGVSRSFTHELVRHRVGFAYSQLSQRYVDESDTDFVVPDCIADDPEAFEAFKKTMEVCLESYERLTETLTKQFLHIEDKTLRRKTARQAARSVLPNATETKIYVTANARALRHFIELRASEHAETEIRKVAVEVLKIMQKEAPNIFGDYKLTDHWDGTQVAFTEWEGV